MLYNGRFVKSEDSVKATPYDTGKIKIGMFYTPQLYQAALTPEERLVQDILLDADGAVKAPVWVRVLGKLLRV